MSDTQAKYAVYGTAREIFNGPKARAPELLYCGPAGTGKSFACLLKVHLFCMKYPGVRVLIVRKTLASLGGTALDTYRKHIAKHVLANGDVSYYGGSAAEPPQFKYSNGSCILIGGMDNAMKVMSAEYDLVYAQEATELKESDWEAITTRLRNGKADYHQLLADCNPQEPTHWLKARCDQGKTAMVNSRHEDNPAIFEQIIDENGKWIATGPMKTGPQASEYMSKLDALTGVRYKRLRKGLWAAAEGLVYSEFDPATHIIEKFAPPASWTRYWSIDFGYTNPFVCQWWAEDPDGRLYLYRELYMTQKLVEDHARTIMEQVTKDVFDEDTGEFIKTVWTEPKPRVIVGDHDAEGRATFEKHTGLRITPAKKEVSVGIQAVESRFKTAGDGKPRIFFMDKAVIERDPELDGAKKPCSSPEEILVYIWDIKEGKAPKEVPVKEFDHGMDAMRYVVMECERGSRPRFRILG